MSPLAGTGSAPGIGARWPVRSASRCRPNRSPHGRRSWRAPETWPQRGRATGSSGSGVQHARKQADGFPLPALAGTRFTGTGAFHAGRSDASNGICTVLRGFPLPRESTQNTESRQVLWKREMALSRKRWRLPERAAPARGRVGPSGRAHGEGSEAAGVRIPARLGLKAAGRRTRPGPTGREAGDR